MHPRTLETLEYDALIALLARHVQSPLGRGRVWSLRPCSDRAKIEVDLDRTTECVQYHRAGQVFGFSGIVDPGESIARLQIEATRLEPRQILELERLIAVGLEVRSEFRDPETKDRFPLLAQLAATIPDLRKLVSSIAGKILPNGELDDNASPELRRVRREILHARERIEHSLGSILRGQDAAVQEEIITIRNGRFVIPVRTDSRAQIPGVVHGLSSSGHTSFIEPLGVIGQNNELVSLREHEEIEIAIILDALSASLRENLDGIRAIVETLQEFDFVQAKARLSAEFNCVRPLIHNTREFALREARHPLLESSLRGSTGKVVPISFSMDESHQLMVISGPNAGGKTVALKTAGLMALMAQSGLHVPAKEMTLPIFAEIFADIGDQQSVSANLSTFTAHIRNVTEMAEQLRLPALLLLDEVGTGTDPQEGAALAVAVLDHFRRASATTLATTHYNDVKMWASEVVGILNASVEFDTGSLRPTYRLIVGLAGASCGLDIARRMSLPEPILAMAQERIRPEQREATEYLKRLKALVDQQEASRLALDDERRATAEQYCNLERDFTRTEERRRTSFQAELSRIVDHFTQESKRLIDSLKDRATAVRLKKQSDAHASNLRRSASIQIESFSADAKKHIPEKPAVSGVATDNRRETPESEIPASPSPTVLSREAREGDRVLITSLNREGVVDSIHQGRYSVRVGSLRLRVRKEELIPIQGTAGPQTPARAGPAGGIDLDREIPAELKVIGMSGADASVEVDKFLDSAFLAGNETVRIIHGHGTGALRRAIANLLTGHPQVESFSPAPSNQGGSGATIVVLRK